MSETRDQPTPLSHTQEPEDSACQSDDSPKPAVTDDDGPHVVLSNVLPANEHEASESKGEEVRVHVNTVSRSSTGTRSSKSLQGRFPLKRSSFSFVSDVLGPDIHWYTPTMMLLLGLAGLFGALGHHLYNNHLDRRPVNGDAQWPQRWGVALAFFVKMTLVGAVQMSVKQRSWLTVKKRAFKVKTLDSIFHSCYDPAEFFDRDLFTGAFFPALLALLVWILPLSAIASPSTLTAVNGMRTDGAMCYNVSTLDFSRENGYGIDKRQPDVDKSGMSYWDYFYDNETSIYNQPSMDSRKNFQLSMLSDAPLQPTNPCPTDSNCTFSLSFDAPAYKCEHREDFGGMRTYNMSQMAPFGDMLYASYSSFEEDYVGRPLDWNLTVPDANTGVFKREPSLWIGWVYNTTVPATEENATQWNTSYWPHQIRTHVMECSLWNSTYSYDMSFLQGSMVINAYHVQHNKPFLQVGETMAPWMPTYMEYAGFHGTGWLYRTMLAGNISQQGQDDYVITESDISQTMIIDPGNAMPLSEDLAPYIEEAFQNIYLSMLADIKQYSQLLADLPCEVSAQVLVWSYKPTWLAVSYCIAVGLTFAAIGVGLHAIVVNGYVAQTNFSTFLVTTRNPDLDRMAEGSYLGAWPMKKEVRHTRLKFGQTQMSYEGGPGVSHAAFGFEDKVKPIEKSA